MIQTYRPHECGHVEAIRQFRETVYARDGVSIKDTDWMDEDSWHIVAFDHDEIVGCLRYTPFSGTLAWAGGWAVEGARYGVAGRLILAGVKLAKQLGQSVMAAATVRHGAASILERLGGKAIAQYNDAMHGCAMRLLKFE